EVEHPEQRQLAIAAGVVAADRAVEAVPAESRLAERPAVDPDLAPLELVDDGAEGGERLLQMLGADEVEVVVRGVVLGVASPGGAGERADRQAVAGGVVLPLVVAERDELLDRHVESG